MDKSLKRFLRMKWKILFTSYGRRMSVHHTNIHSVVSTLSVEATKWPKVEIKDCWNDVTITLFDCLKDAKVVLSTRDYINIPYDLMGDSSIKREYCSTDNTDIDKVISTDNNHFIYFNLKSKEVHVRKNLINSFRINKLICKLFILLKHKVEIGGLQWE